MGPRPVGWCGSPGSSHVAQAEENAGAIAHGPLTPAQMAEIDALLHPQPV